MYMYNTRTYYTYIYIERERCIYIYIYIERERDMGGTTCHLSSATCLMRPYCCVLFVVSRSAIIRYTIRHF